MPGSWERSITHSITEYSGPQYFKRAYKKDGCKSLSRTYFDRTRGNDFIMKTVFTVRVVKHQHRLPKEVVDASFLATFRMSLVTVGRWLDSLWRSLPTQTVLIPWFHDNRLPDKKQYLPERAWCSEASYCPLQIMQSCCKLACLGDRMLVLHFMHL